MPEYDIRAGPKGQSVRKGRQLDEAKLIRRCTSYLNIHEQDEGARLRSDRIGTRMIYNQHWTVPMPVGRSAVVYGKSGALVHHKISIMTKQDPIPVIMPDEQGDQEAARYMRLILQRLWREDDMKLKLRAGLLLANCTRTCALKVMWDPVLRGGNGDIATDVIPGWKLILDPRVSDINRSEFCGHRERMSRSRAMILYPESADIIEEGPQARDMVGALLGSRGPMTNQWRSGISFPSTGTTINTKGVLLTQTDIGPSTAPSSTGEAEDQVEVVEMYHRDASRFKTTEIERDHLGNEINDLMYGNDGLPEFEELPDEDVWVDEIGGYLGLPNYSLRTQPRMKTEYKPKYPFWRRTTWMMPDGTLLEDCAWDGPLPYALLSDTLTLEGIWARGSLLYLYELQGVADVGLSAMVDNLRMGSMQVFLAGAMSGLQDDQLITSPGKVIKCQDESKVVPLPVPQVSEHWISFLNFISAAMEDVFGASGVMQGESQGRVDSSAGYDTLAEIGGSRIVESTQRMESALADWAAIAGWFAQKKYSRSHQIAVEDAEGNVTWEQAYGPLLFGSFSYHIATGSTLAWSESAMLARTLQLFTQGFIDKIEVYKRINYPDWQSVVKRMLTEDPRLAGPGGQTAPPPKPKQQTQTKRPKTAPPPLQAVG